MLERGDDTLLTMKSNSPVKGRFTARQEVPLDMQLLGAGTLLAGLAGLVFLRR